MSSGKTWLRTAVVSAVGALALAAAGVVVHAQPAGPGGGPGFRHGGFGPGRFGFARMARALDLTDEQQASLKSLVDEQRKAAEPLFKQHRELRQQIRQQLDSGNPDAATVGRLSIQAHGIGRQLRDSHAQMKDRFAALLTPEQKTKLEALEKAGGWRGHRGFRPHRGGPPDQGGPDSSM